MKKILIVLGIMFGLIGVGVSIWCVTNSYASYETETIKPSIGFEN